MNEVCLSLNTLFFLRGSVALHIDLAPARMVSM